MSSSENTLGKKIKELRKDKGLSQEEFAFQINVSRQTVYFWETGKVIPDSQKILTICQKFSIDPNELLFDKKEPAEDTVCSADAECQAGIECSADLAISGRPDKKKKLSKNQFAILLIAIACCLTVILSVVLGIIFGTNDSDENGLDKVYSSQTNLNVKHVLYVVFGVAIIIAIIIISIVANKKVKGDKTKWRKQEKY